MNILAIETSTEACSAALLVNSEIEERFQVAPRGHGDLILKMVDELLSVASLKPQQLSAIAFGRGPGAFTGVRIATSVAQGIAFAADLPVVPVSTLATLAQGAYRKHNQTSLLCAIDARMGEIYWGGFRVEQGLVLPLAEECVCAAEDAPDLPGEHYGVGSGWDSYQPLLKRRYQGQIKAFDQDLLPRAHDTVILAESAYQAGKIVSAENALPVYLRDNVVKKSS